MTYFALLRGPCSDACMKSASAAADEKSQHNVSADRYHSTLMVNTEAESEEQMLHIPQIQRSEEHTSELQSHVRISYAVFCLKKKKTTTT